MEKLAMISGNLYGGVVVLVVGLIIRTGKASFMVAGFNTMSEEEQAGWDIQKISRYLGNFLVMGAVILLLGCSFVLFDTELIRTIILCASWLIFTGLILWCVFRMNFSSAFKIKK